MVLLLHCWGSRGPLAILLGVTWSSCYIVGGHVVLLLHCWSHVVLLLHCWGSCGENEAQSGAWPNDHSCLTPG